MRELRNKIQEINRKAELWADPLRDTKGNYNFDIFDHPIEKNRKGQILKTCNESSCETANLIVECLDVTHSSNLPPLEAGFAITGELASEIRKINDFSIQRIKDKEAIGMSDYRRIEHERLEQIADACFKYPCTIADVVLECLSVVYLYILGPNAITDTQYLSSEDAKRAYEARKAYINHRARIIRSTTNTEEPKGYLGDGQDYGIRWQEKLEHYAKKPLTKFYQFDAFFDVKGDDVMTPDKEGIALMGSITEELMNGCGVRVLVRKDQPKDKDGEVAAKVCLALQRIVNWIERDGINIFLREDSVPPTKVSEEQIAEHPSPFDESLEPEVQTNLELKGLNEIGLLAGQMLDVIEQLRLSIQAAYKVEFPALIPEIIRQGIALIQEDAGQLERITRKDSTRPF